MIEMVALRMVVKVGESFQRMSSDWSLTKEAASEGTSLKVSVTEQKYVFEPCEISYRCLGLFSVDCLKISRFG